MASTIIAVAVVVVVVVVAIVVAGADKQLPQVTFPISILNRTIRIRNG